MGLARAFTGETFAIMAAKGYGLASAVLSIAFAARAFSAEDFGIWSVVITLQAITAGFDLGLANAVRNRLVFGSGRGDEQVSAISVAFKVLCCWALILVVVSFLIDIARFSTLVLKGVDPTHLDAGSQALLLGLILAFARLPLSLGLNSFLSFGLGHAYAWFDVLLSSTSLLGTAAALLLHLNVATTIGIQFGAALITSFYAFHRLLNVGDWSWTHLASERFFGLNRAWILKDGAPFFALQLVALFSSVASTVVVSASVSTSEAGIYRAIYSGLSAILALQMAYLMPRWTAFTRMAAESDIAVLRHELINVLLQSSVFLGPLWVFVIVGPQLVSFWLGTSVIADTSFALMGVWASASVFHVALSVFLNGVGLQLGSLIAYAPSAFVMIPLGAMIAERYGMAGVAASMAITSVLSLLLMVVIVFYSFKKYFGIHSK